MFGRNGNFTGNALLGQIVTEHRKPLKWTRDLGRVPMRCGTIGTDKGLYAQGRRTDYLIVPVIDSGTDKRVGWKLRIDPGTYGERTFDYDTQAEAKDHAVVHEANH